MGQTFFITLNCEQKKHLLQSHRMAGLFLKVLYEYRERHEFLIHAFVVMPNHVHLMISTSATLERALQLIKGGFSHRARKEFKLNYYIWQQRSYDRRMRNIAEYKAAVKYIHDNPVQARLATRSEEFEYSSACGRFDLDAIPQWLKPQSKARGAQA